MGIVCELYRMSDSEIGKLEKLSYDDAEEFLDENYASIDGKYHKQNDTVFSMDKGWGITSFLLQQFDNSEDKVLNSLNQRFIKSDVTRRINSILKSVEIEDLIPYYDKTKLLENGMYGAKRDFTWDYIDKYHLRLYKLAFERASELNHGITLNYH